MPSPEEVKRYTVWALMQDGSVHHRLFKGPPTDSMMIKWAKGDPRGYPASRVPAGWFLVRYYPSRKGWKVIDIRQARLVTKAENPNVSWYAGVQRGTRLYPSPDAAIMHVLAVAYQQRVDG